MKYRHNPNLKHWCRYWEKECDKKTTDKNPHNQNWYEYNCQLVERYCPKSVPIESTLPLFLITSVIFIIILKTKTIKL
jgi:hypothetical protein